jgi:DNA primase
VSRFIIEEIHRDELRFSNPVYQKIFDLYDESLQSGSSADEMIFNFGTDHEDFRNIVNGLTISRYELSENWLKNRIQVTTEKEVLMKALEMTILSFKSKAVDRMMAELQQELKGSTDEEDILILLSKQKALKDISRKINSRLGRIIVR